MCCILMGCIKSKRWIQVANERMNENNRAKEKVVNSFICRCQAMDHSSIRSDNNHKTKQLLCSFIIHLSTSIHCPTSNVNYISKPFSKFSAKGVFYSFSCFQLFRKRISFLPLICNYEFAHFTRFGNISTNETNMRTILTAYEYYFGY